jgi:hypothetical protein
MLEESETFMRGQGIFNSKTKYTYPLRHLATLADTSPLVKGREEIANVLVEKLWL